jgi:hypothetical protein
MGVPSPTRVSKSQRGANVSTLEPQEPLTYGSYSLKSDLDYSMQENSWDLCRESGLAFCSTRLSTQVPSLTSKTCYHVGIHVLLWIVLAKK